jgi:hypothetical protein
VSRVLSDTLVKALAGGIALLALGPLVPRVSASSGGQVMPTRGREGPAPQAPFCPLCRQRKEVPPKPAGPAPERQEERSALLAPTEGDTDPRATRLDDQVFSTSAGHAEAIFHPPRA